MVLLALIGNIRFSYFRKLKIGEISRLYLPEGLYEAAMIDGVRPTGYLFRILLPLSTAALATVTLFYAVGYWNDYFTSILFIRNRDLWPMQRILREALLTSQFNTMMYDDARHTQPPEPPCWHQEKYSAGRTILPSTDWQPSARLVFRPR